MSTYITDADLKTALAARLKRSSTTNMTTDSPHWDVLITQANQQAYDTILTELLGRGYTQANIDGWDRRVEFNRRLAICTLFREGTAVDAVAQDAIDRICKCEEELKEIQIMVDGVIVTPASGSGNIRHGELDSVNDRFQRDTSVSFERDW